MAQCHASNTGTAMLGPIATKLKEPCLAGLRIASVYKAIRCPLYQGSEFRIISYLWRFRHLGLLIASNWNRLLISLGNRWKPWPFGHLVIVYSYTLFVDNKITPL